MLTFRMGLLLMTAALLAAAATPPAAESPRSPAQSLEQVASPMTADERGRVIAELADALAAEYLYAPIGAQYAAALKRNLAQGAYDRLDQPAAFAQAVTSDLQAVAPDLHLRMGLKDGFHRPRPFDADTPRSARPNGAAGLEEASMLPGGVAYLRFNAFPDEPETGATARAFLLSHADARAVILDCRPNRGGGVAVMNAILPLFYGRPTVQIRMDTRASAEARSPSETEPGLVRRPSPSGIVRFDHVIEPDRTHTRLRDVPLYYLTSRRTASAAEHLALALKRNHRATLVGETTLGANHYGVELALGSRFAAFIPVGRSYDPDTGQDWEGSGISPDVAVPADQALEAALALVRSRAARPAHGQPETDASASGNHGA